MRIRGSFSTFVMICVIGVLAPVGASAAVEPASVAPRESATRPAACKASYAGAIQWKKGKIWGWATARNCSTIKYKRVCAQIWSYNAMGGSPGAAPVSTKCLKPKKNGIAVPTTKTQKCIPGQYWAEVHVTTSQGKTLIKRTKRVDTTGGCPKQGSVAAR
ncbi:hypothetical protein [Aeromicrobium duanguangcaii]|uniref:Uncharacterized protein n=1 Tax=Aeromicrobium duanguangcaii TaxID=2968086 RepID=A0ABY5KGQ2_9ACTN|nr:hypothetical protein [Aeromicrobium duanguangcaii]MCD9153240.1 hypothetical protein [Aeromicrobium duanguangcaii]UUI69661.1 hypothetical protein NP095_06090 [Aeromicrobium duanguangcaii]